MRADLLPRRSRLGDVIAGDPAPIEDGRVTCQVMTGQPGVIGSESGFISIDGYLDRRAYRRIVDAAEGMLELGVSRVGLIVDSGGGELAGLGDAVQALVSLRQELRGQLYSFAARSAGSCAYALLACGAPGKVYAASGAFIGSVKAIVRVEDTQRLYEEGLLTTAHLITSGAPLKQIGAPGAPVTPEQLDFLRQQVGSADAGFIALAAAARGVAPREMARMAGEGGLYDAAIARQIGLIDGLMEESRFRALVEGGPNQENPMTLPLTGGQAPPPIQGQAPAQQPAPAQTAPPAGAYPPQAQTPTAGPPAFPTPGVTAGPPMQPYQPWSYTPSGPAPTIQTGAGTAQPAPPPGQAVTPQSPDMPPWAVSLAQSVATVGQSVATLATAIGGERVSQRIEGFKSRIQACVGSRITASGGEAKAKLVEQLVNAGQAEAAEAVVADVEAQPLIDESANLSAVVTYQPPDAQEPVSEGVDLTYYSVPGPGGEAVIPNPVRARALEALNAVAGAPKGREMEALEGLYRQVGFLGGRA